MTVFFYVGSAVCTGHGRLSSNGMRAVKEQINMPSIDIGTYLALIRPRARVLAPADARVDTGELRMRGGAHRAP